jgi:short subunit dehydrogenase-like uncharacterized protein
MRRVIVLGGHGFFGSHAVRLLREAGIPAIATSRSDADTEDRRSLRAYLHPHDVVLDAAGPFQARSAALLEVAMARGVDIVDLSDSLAYAQLVEEHRTDIAAHHITVLTGCSAISAVVATLAGSSGIGTPSQVDAWLAPASKDTANVATARSLLASVKIGVLKTCRFAPVTGLEVESALGPQLRAIWPAVERASFWVDPHVPGLATLLGLTRAPLLRRALERAVPIGVALARLAGSRSGTFAVEALGSRGTARWVAHAARGSYLVALAPAVLAVKRLAADEHAYQASGGLVPADEQVPVTALLAYLREHGVTVERV